MNKYIIASIIVSLAIFGGYFFPRNHTVVQQAIGAVGDTNSTRKIASCVLDMSTTSATFATTTTNTTSCLYNTDSKTRIITSIEYYISGLGAINSSNIASTTWIIGTSSDVYNVPAAASDVLSTTIATTTANGVVSGRLFISTSTPGATATFVNREWASGTNLNLQQNASSTASATILVNYFLNN